MRWPPAQHARHAAARTCSLDHLLDRHCIAGHVARDRPVDSDAEKLRRKLSAIAPGGALDSSSKCPCPDPENLTCVNEHLPARREHPLRAPGATDASKAAVAMAINVPTIGSSLWPIRREKLV